MDIEKYYEKELKSGNRSLNNLKEQWDKRAFEFYKNTKDDNLLETIDLLKNYIELKDLLILDIGSGFGKYSSYFEKENNKVDIVEISSQMIKYLKDNYKRNNIGDNIKNRLIINDSWENIDLNKYSMKDKYDLVFISHNPAISSSEMLQKALDTCSGLLFISGHLEYEDTLFKEIKEKYYENESQIKEKSHTRMVNIFNLLYLMGKTPDFIVRNKIENKISQKGDLIPRYLMWLSKSHLSEEEYKKEELKLLEILKKYEEDGLIKHKIEVMNAYIICKIKK